MTYLANEFAQVRESLERLRWAISTPNEFRPKADDALTALARIEQHTHTTEKALRAARLHLRPEIGGRFDQRAAVAAIDAALSAGEGTPQ